MKKTTAITSVYINLHTVHSSGLLLFIAGFLNNTSEAKIGTTCIQGHSTVVSKSETTKKTKIRLKWWREQSICTYYFNHLAD